MLGQSFWGFWGFLRLLVSLCLRYCQSALWVFVPEHITDSLLIMGPDWSVVTVSPQWATTHIQQSAVCQRRSGSTHITAGPIQPTLPLLSASQTHKVAAAATLPSELNTVCLHRCSLCSDLDHILPFERIFCCMENSRLQTAVSWWSWVLSLFSDNLTRLRPDIGSICPVAPVQSDVSNTNRRGSAAALCCISCLLFKLS